MLASRTVGLLVLALSTLGLGLFYFGSFAHTAWHPTDYEYVVACMDRVLRGQLPYRDFIYHKPPGTLYLHLWEMLLPGAWPVLAGRLAFYLELAIAAAAPAAWALWRRPQTMHLRACVLPAAFFALAAHNFPAMAWQTTDGALFAVLGLVAVAESRCRPAGAPRWAWRSLGSLLLVLAILCKQSFFTSCAFFALVVTLELWADRARWRTQALPNLLASVVPPALLLGALALVFSLTGMKDGFFAQLRSQSTAAALVEHSRLFFTGGKVSTWGAIGSWALLPLASAVVSGSDHRWRAWLGELLAWVALAALAVGVLRGAPDEPQGYLSVFSFRAAAGLFLGQAARWAWELGRARRGAASERLERASSHLFFAGALFSVAFGAVFSLGYPSPLLGMAGAGLVFHDALPDTRRRWQLWPALAVTLLVGASLYRVADERPYRDLPRSQLTSDLGDHFDRLATLRTNRHLHQRYGELKALLARHAGHRPFVVTEDWIAIHWLTGTSSPWAIDWTLSPEPNGFEPRLWADLERSRPVAIVPKRKNEPVGEGASAPTCAELGLDEHSEFSRRIAQQWTLREDSPSFCVFEP